MRHLAASGITLLVSITALVFGQFAISIAGTGPATLPTTSATESDSDVTDIEWSFDDKDKKEGLVASVEKFVDQSGDCRLSVEVAPGSPHRVTIRILRGDKLVCSFTGHDRSDFLRKDNIFVYADFRSDAAGGAIVAVDLTSGKEIWRSELQSIDKAYSGSPYSNRICLTIGVDSNDNWKTQIPRLMIWRDETGGQYLEMKNFESGATTGHHRYQPHPAK